MLMLYRAERRFNSVNIEGSKLKSHEVRFKNRPWKFRQLIIFHVHRWKRWKQMVTLASNWISNTCTVIISQVQLGTEKKQNFFKWLNHYSLKTSFPTVWLTQVSEKSEFFRDWVAIHWRIRFLQQQHNFLGHLISCCFHSNLEKIMFFFAR